MYLQDRHAGNMCQRLGHQQIGVVELPDPGAEQPRAPSTVPAARIGTACTEAKPASVAAATNRGHRAASACTSDTEIGCPVA